MSKAMAGMNDVYNLSMAPLHGAGRAHHRHQGSGSKTGQRKGQPSFVGSGIGDLLKKGHQLLKDKKVISNLGSKVVDFAKLHGYGKKHRGKGKRKSKK